MSKAATKISDKHTEQAELSTVGQQRAPAPNGAYSAVLALQASAGNRAVDRLLGSDSHRTAVSANVPPAVQAVLASGGGQPLDLATRAEMEASFGHDFSDVRVHTGERAEESAAAVSANAYTVGRNIVFSEGGYAPETSEGKRLLAHELAHVVQQSRSGVTQALEPAAESEASQAAAQVSSGQPAIVQSAMPAGVQRQSASSSKPPFLMKSYDQEKLTPTELIAAISNISKWIHDNPDDPQINNAKLKLVSLLELYERKKVESPTSSSSNLLSTTALMPAPDKGPAFKSITWVGKPPSPDSPLANTKVRLGPKGPEFKGGQSKPEFDFSPPRPPTSFEEKITKDPRMNPFYHPIRDRQTGQIVGWRYDDNMGYQRFYDINGNILDSAEKPLEQPPLDPIDFIPFETLGSLAGKGLVKLGAKVLSRGALKVGTEEAAKFGVKGAGKLETKEVAKIGAEGTGKLGTKEAAELGGKDVLTTGAKDVATTGARDVSAAGTKDIATAGTKDIATAGAKDTGAATAKDVAAAETPGKIPPGMSVNELAEPGIIAKHFPKARQLQRKATGFDAVDRGTVVFAKTEFEESANAIVTEEWVKGGNWIQIKIISKPKIKNIQTEIARAIDKIQTALKGVRKPKAERIGQTGYAWRVIPLQPDKITILLQLEDQEVTENLVNAAEEYLLRFDTSDLPPIHILITGK